MASVSVWMSAFCIFVGVYTQKYPHESPALMKYGAIVLWLRSQYSSNKPAGSVQRAGVPANEPPFLNIPRGHCFKFHKGDTHVPAASLNAAALNVGACTPL